MRAVISSLLALVLLGAFPLAHDGRGSLDPGFAEWIAKQPAGGPGYGEIVRRFLEAAGRDVAAYERGMDQLECDFRTALESRGKLADGAARLAALKKFFFEEQGFRADLDLQLPENLYPDAILERRRGYCLGLTLVLLDLGERLQWPFAVASAPRHIFLRDIGTASRDDALAISAPRRIRDKEHLRYVASQPCLVCGRSPGHAHHVRFVQPRAIGRKVSDEWVVPLCVTHHRSLHTVGNEEKWWKERGINPIAHAERLWGETRGQDVAISVKTRELVRIAPAYTDEPEL